MPNDIVLCQKGHICKYSLNFVGRRRRPITIHWLASRLWRSLVKMTGRESIGQDPKQSPLTGLGSDTLSPWSEFKAISMLPCLGPKHRHCRKRKSYRRGNSQRQEVEFVLLRRPTAPGGVTLHIRESSMAPQGLFVPDCMGGHSDWVQESLSLYPISIYPSCHNQR